MWDKHWRRLKTGVEAIGLKLPRPEKAAYDQLIASIEAEGVENGRARITVFDEGTSPIWHDNGEQKTGFTMFIAGMRPMREKVRLTDSPFQVNSRSPLAGIKSCNYLENIMAIDDAKRRGFDEAIRLNERGEVASACMANVFWVKRDLLFTPSLKTGCLPGTTREYVQDVLECRDVEAGFAELEMADAIFLTSAGLGIVEVAELGSKKLERSGHSIMSIWPPPA